MADDELEKFYENMQNPFVAAVTPDMPVPVTPAGRYTRLFAKGATLGMVGRNVQAESIPEHLTEFAGSILPTAAVTGGVGSVLGATKAGAALAKLGPAASRIATAGASGATYGAGKGLVEVSQGSEGSKVIEEAAKEAAWWMAGEGAFLGIGRLWRGAPKSKTQAIAQQEKIDALKGVEPESASKIQQREREYMEWSGDLADWRVPRYDIPPASSLVKPGPPVAEYGPDISRTGPWHETLHHGKIEKQPGFFENAYRTDEPAVYALVDEGATKPPAAKGRKTIDDSVADATPQEIESVVQSGAPMKDFIRSIDNETNIETLVSTNKTTDTVVDSMVQQPRSVGLQFTPEQAERLVEPSVVAKLEAPLLEKEASMTSKVIQVFDDAEADNFVANKVTELGRVRTITPDPDDLRIREIAKKLGMQDNEIHDLSKTLDSHIDGVKTSIQNAGGKWDSQIERRARIEYLKVELGKRC